MSNILSGEKMVLSHSKTNYELPPVGVKEFEPNHSWLEQKQIQSALDNRKTLLEAERIEKESNLMMADWRAEKRKAAVSRKGKHWEAFGHHSENADWLFPEEVLFLMEMNCLECLYGEVPLSIQKGYSVLLKPENGCSFDEYRVFAHLCRAGYRVLRHLPNLTVTAYERTIRLDQHLKERKTYSDAVTEETVLEEIIGDKTQVPESAHESGQKPEEDVRATQASDGPEETVTEKTQMSNEPEKMVTDEIQVLGEPEKITIETTQLSKKLEETVTDKTPVSREPEEMVTDTEETQVSKKTAVNCIGGLTKRQLRKIQRKNAKELRNKALLGISSVKKSQEFQNLQRRRQRRWLWNVTRKYKLQSTKYGNSQDRRKLKQNEDIRKISLLQDNLDETPEIPSERWQPPVVISDLPENIEMTIGSTPVQAEESIKEQGIIEVIDIANTSSEEEVETDEVESDSDIEIIQEIRPQSHEDEEEDDEEDDLEIIEIPVPKKEIIVETLSSDSEEEEEREDGSGSESERSYDGNWKRNRPKKKNKFVRPPTMSHLTFAAVDEFCAEKKSPKDNIEGNDSEFICLESLNVKAKKPLFQVEKTRNEILDLMPTMAGQNRKLITLDIPDIRLVPNSIIPKQQSYTYSTNALRARVFRQGFRGRRNFHGPRFTSFNPYYNNNVGNFYPNQLSIGGPQGLFQAPQILGGGDISSVARGVMQIASALLMNMPQNNMNNGILPYNPRPHFPIVNSNFSQIESSNTSTSHFPLVNQNFSYNEPSNMNQRGFNPSQRNNLNLQNLFDMPQQRNFGTPNHTRFSDDSSSPVIENNHSSQNFNVDLSRSSESDFDSTDHSFIPPIGNSHSAGRNFRNNRAADFRSKRGKFQRTHQNHRGRFSQRNSRGGISRPPQWIDPAYIKPDIPIPGEQNPLSQGISDFIPINSSNSNQKPVEIISVDDNDDGFVPRGGVSSRFSKRKRMKRKLMRLKEMAKKKCLNLNSDGRTNPEIVFLDSPSKSLPTVEDSTLNSVKQENDSVRVKIESLKLEEISAISCVKRESVEKSGVKVENEAEARVKTEEACEESSGVRVKVEHGESGQNVRVEIKIESSSDTSSVVSLPLANLVKEEPHQIKQESIEVIDIKTEAVSVIENVKTESLVEQEFKEGIVETTATNSKLQITEVDTRERTEVKSMDMCASESERTRQNENESVSLDQTDSNFEVEIGEGNDIDGRNLNSEVLCSRTELASEDVQKKKVSSWTEIKKNNLPLSSFQDTEIQDESENENEDEEEIRPILRPKHCKTIGTVLSALQIFTPFAGSPPEDILRLKISFDLYLPTEFRKSHRGLPQYRIVVFSDSEPLPSPAQLREVNSRFQDKVPVLTAVVAPGSVVFYTFTDVDLPQDSTSYTK